MDIIDNVVNAIQAYNPQAEVDMIRRAYDFSVEAHKTQKRLSGIPYITHPLAVATILTELKMDSMTITSALLHDTLEDTDATEDTLSKLFGSEVTELVIGSPNLAISPLATVKSAKRKVSAKWSSRWPRIFELSLLS